MDWGSLFTRLQLLLQPSIEFIPQIYRQGPPVFISCNFFLQNMSKKLGEVTDIDPLAHLIKLLR
jgi:hypothetical protein